ncbi:MAG TPA: hypothetical protein VIV34_07685 [Pseudolabrys sp.]
MPFDLATVDWPYVAVMAVLAFIAALVGNVLSFKHTGRAALLTALMFAGLFVFWTYYPHRVPLPRSLTTEKAAAPSASTPAPPPAVPAAPVAPRNPVKDITPPDSPAR